ncbi:hypothetical protein LP090_13055 (plasmid) [Moraxella bovis]|nr:hypothetical protein [Moraxella bovis]UZA44375.1 hypothetical protein LP090_13055 [Moraxella bovis]
MDNKFKKARQNTDFVENINSDVTTNEKPTTSTVITRNQKAVTIAENTLSLRERSRTKHGRNLSVPLFVEELMLIEEAVNHLSKSQDISLSTFIRQTLLDKCQKILGKDEYNKINELKYNVVKNKREK